MTTTPPTAPPTIAAMGVDDFLFSLTIEPVELADPVGPRTNDGDPFGTGDADVIDSIGMVLLEAAAPNVVVPESVNVEKTTPASSPAQVV